VTPVSNDDVTDDVTGDKMLSITCCLETKELWKKFHQLGTEMIITKSGRSVYEYWTFRAILVLKIVQMHHIVWQPHQYRFYMYVY